MKIRCVIDRVTFDGAALDGAALTPFQRAQLERALREQLHAALRAGWLDVTPAAAADAQHHAWPRQLRIELAAPAQAAGSDGPARGTPAQALGRSLGQSLGAALVPASAAAPAPAPSSVPRRP